MKRLIFFFELYELQWSRLLHFRSGREATGGLEKKKREKVVGAGMGYCPFSKKKKIEIESQYSRLYCGTQQAQLYCGTQQAHSRLSCIVAHNRLSRHTTC